MKYYWFAKCIDGCFEDYSEKIFDTKEQAYNDMRNAALEKIKWNTEYSEDFDDDADNIDYEITFKRDQIVHTSYSGIYTYQIKELNN